MKYLYGASVQGIQEFIFETNKLKEIVGASELIEQICTRKFQNKVKNYDLNNLIVGAAGKIKYIFKNKDDCESLVYSFAKTIMEEAPGITISQAVCSFEGELSKPDIDKLEQRLKTQRNKAIGQNGMGLMISERARRTGKSGIKWKNDIVIDKAQESKEKYSKEAYESLMNKILCNDSAVTKENFAIDIGDIVDDDRNNWLAIVHADGNNLGKMIQHMAEELDKNSKSVQSAFREFSEQLEKATVQAVKIAYKIVVRGKKSENDKIPIRPIILGGDDMTIIIRGDLAMDFTYQFLENFQMKTKEHFADIVKRYSLPEFKNGLTACAGIAYIKPKYPFHYGVDLAEGLCAYSKKIAKEINDKKAPSCITFHKVHSSFIENYNEIIERELTANDGANKVKFNFGPYFLNHQENYFTVEQLKFLLKEIKKDDAPDAGLRNWVSELHNNQAQADQTLSRIINITHKYVEKLKLERIFTNRKGEAFTHIYDVLSLASIEKNKI